MRREVYLLSRIWLFVANLFIFLSIHLEFTNVLILILSQLSSKCDNRQFCIKFGISKFEGFRFLEDFSPSIRCISRNRTPRTSTIIWKKTSTVHPLNGSQSFGLDDVSYEPKHSAVHEAKLSSTSKRVRLGEAKISTIDQLGDECNSLAWTANQVLIETFVLFISLDIIIILCLNRQ